MFSVVKGSLEKGYASEAPFDVIFLNGAVEVIPDALFDQLRDGGRLIAVVGYGNASAAQVYVREALRCRSGCVQYVGEAVARLPQDSGIRFLRITCRHSACCACATGSRIAALARPSGLKTRHDMLIFRYLILSPRA